MNLNSKNSNIIHITSSSRRKFREKKVKLKAEAEMKSFLITADLALFILFSVFLILIILPILLLSYALAIPFYPIFKGEERRNSINREKKLTLVLDKSMKKKL
jgi:hypothetical protein